MTAHEGCKLTAYDDGRGVPTIGVGHTGKVRGIPLVVGTTKITQAESDALLAADTAQAEAAVDRLLSQRARDKLTPAQTDALVSFIFNIGGPGFATSGVRLALESNLGVAADAAGPLLNWTRAGSDKYVLFKRRACEAMLLIRGVYMGTDLKELP